MTVALLEVHRGFQQDQDREEANSAFLGLIDRGTKGVRSIRETIWQRIKKRLCASVIVNGSQRLPSPVVK
jgi:hypothetical protein